MNTHKHIQVGIGILIFKDKKILLGRRKGAHGKGDYASTGGHMKFGESLEECAHRETFEEAGIKIENVRFLVLSNMRNVWKDKHYIHVGLISDWKSGEPKVIEKDKLESWNWYDLNNLPEPLFESTKQAIKCFKNGVNYIDY